MAMPNRLQRVTSTVLQSDNLQPLFEEIERYPEELQPRSCDKVLSQMWQAEKFDCAAQFTAYFFEQHPTSPKIHKWVQRILSEQQHLSEQFFSPELLEKFQPSIAQADSGG